MNDVVVVGSGERKVLCLNGWFGHARAWGPFVDALDRDTYTYAFVDYRGYGGSKGLQGEYSMDEIAADALGVADRLGWSTFSVVGHSMGGQAALRVAVAAPSRVERVLGITPVPPSGYPFDEAGWGFFSAAAASGDVRYAILDLTTGKRLTPTFIKALLAGSMGGSTPEAFAGYLTAWGRTDFAAAAAKLSCPVHLIVGEHDPAVSVGLLSATAQQHSPQATIETLSNAGHYPMFETPVALATALERALG